MRKSYEQLDLEKLLTESLNDAEKEWYPALRQAQSPEI
jgi:hypothetical protein